MIKFLPFLGFFSSTIFDILSDTSQPGALLVIGIENI